MGGHLELGHGGVRHLFGFFFFSARSFEKSSRGCKNHTPPFSSEEFVLQKKWGPLRKNLGCRYVSLIFVGALYVPPAWKIVFEARNFKNFPRDRFRWW